MRINWLDTHIPELRNEVITSLDPLTMQYIPNTTILLNNYPNPFNSVTTIRYSFGGNFDVETRCIASIPVELSIYNLLGEKMETLVSEMQPEGTYKVTWNGRNSRGRGAGSGIYYYVLRSGTIQKSKKMVLIR